MPTFLKKPRTFHPAPALFLFAKPEMLDVLVVPATFLDIHGKSAPGVAVSVVEPERLVFSMTIDSARTLVAELQRAIDEAGTDGNA